MALGLDMLCLIIEITQGSFLRYQDFSGIFIEEIHPILIERFIIHCKSFKLGLRFVKLIIMLIQKLNLSFEPLLEIFSGLDYD
jgi:hypothetical protein